MRCSWRWGWSGIGLICAVSAHATVIDIDTNTADIQGKIDAAGINDELYFHVGTYSVNLRLKGNLVVKGEEAARTILRGKNAKEPVLTLVNARAVTVQRLTLTDAVSGVTVQTGSSDIKVRNAIFNMGAAGTAVMVNGDAVATIENNTFHGNGVGVQRATDGVSIKFNIFSNNQQAISASGDNAIEYNCFANNTLNGRQGSNATTGGKVLSFVDASLRDFHLQADSLCVDSGVGTDIIDDSVMDAGAYGGEFADPQPYPVQNLKAVATAENGSFRIDLSWTGNRSYLVADNADPGKYILFYDTKAGPPFEGGDALDSQGNAIVSGKNTLDYPATDYSLHGLSGAATMPAVPGGLTAEPSDRKLSVSWAPVAGATAYRLYYGIDSTAENSVEVNDGTRVTLGDLQNGVTYRLAVAALTSKRYYLAVKVSDNSDKEHLSDYAQTRVTVGEPLLGGVSAEVTAVPEKLQAYPELANEGCFIATAAFGYYDAREIRPLRQFRDRYLLAAAPGRAFVAWYYRHGPLAAQWLRQHPQFKPAVRALLAPLIVFAWATVNYPLLALACLLLPFPLLARRWRLGVQA